jgi:hypothetical protein
MNRTLLVFRIATCASLYVVFGSSGAWNRHILVVGSVSKLVRGVGEAGETARTGGCSFLELRHIRADFVCLERKKRDHELDVKRFLDM